MRTVQVLLGVVVLGGVWTLYHLCRFPGGWSYAFGSRFQADRQDLTDAREAVRTLKREAHKEREAALLAVSEAENSRTRRIRALRDDLERLEAPGRGERVDELGDLVLYENVLHTASGTAYELTGLQVRFERDGDGRCSLHVIPAHGDDDLVRCPASHTGGEVRRFERAVQDRIKTHNSLVRRRAEQAVALRARIEEAEADTSEADDARERLAAVTARQREDEALPAAEAELRAALNRWKRLTGRRPSS